jgi:hypothetical protein
MGTKQTVMTPQTLEEDTSRSSREIEQDIRARRDKMDHTLDELGNRLTLRSLVHTALEWWDEPPSGNQASLATRKACKSLARQIKHHPMPSLLIGGGIAWLIADSADDEERSPRTFSPRPQEDGAESAGAKVAESLGHAKEAVGDALETAKEKVAGYSDSASELTHRAVERGKSTARKVSHEIAHGCEVGTQSFSRAVEESPLGVGVAFAALGALLGLALPHSRKEDELMGGKSEELLHTAKEKGEELLETGKVIGERVLETVKEEAKEQGLTGASVSGAVGVMVAKGSKVVEKAKSEAMHAMHEKDEPTSGSAGQLG